MMVDFIDISFMCLGAHDKRTEPDWFRQIASELIRVLLRRRVTLKCKRHDASRQADERPRKFLRGPAKCPLLRGDFLR